MVKYSSPIVSFKINVETKNDVIVLTAPKFLIKVIEKSFAYVEISN